MAANYYYGVGAHSMVFTADYDPATAPVKAGMYGFEVGTNYVPYDMVAQLHQGEAVVPRAYNPAAGGSSAANAELVAEVRSLRAELAAQNRAIAENTLATAKIMRRWHGDGMPEVRTV